MADYNGGMCKAMITPQYFYVTRTEIASQVNIGIGHIYMGWGDSGWICFGGGYRGLGAIAKAGATKTHIEIGGRTAFRWALQWAIIRIPVVVLSLENLNGSIKVFDRFHENFLEPTPVTPRAARSGKSFQLDASSVNL